MSIITYLDSQVWIESFQTSITLEDAAGTDASPIITLGREGIFLGCSLSATGGTVSNTNSQALGMIRVMTSALGILNIGAQIRQVRMLAEKAIGTSGNTTFQINVMLIMKQAR